MGYEIPFDRYRSLIELDADAIDPEAYEEERGRWVARLASKPVRKLTPAELCFLIREQCALRYTAPLAMEKLAEDPFLEASEYPGDLIGAVLESAGTFWREHYDLWCEMISILEEAVTQIQQRMEAEERGEYLPWHIGDDFMAALVHFRGLHKE